MEELVNHLGKLYADRSFANDRLEEGKRAVEKWTDTLIQLEKDIYEFENELIKKAQGEADGNTTDTQNPPARRGRKAKE